MTYLNFFHLGMPFHKKVWSSFRLFTKIQCSSFRDRSIVGFPPFSNCSLGAGFPRPGTTLTLILFALFSLNQNVFTAGPLAFISPYLNKDLHAAQRAHTTQASSFLDYLYLEHRQSFLNSSGEPL
ncbi:MAG: hypothetical protein IBJ00_01500 [Alphaproteobacteria bacterium]|nr:hypothetical protein [Alphaproteobacteria bacterium]